MPRFADVDEYLCLDPEDVEMLQDMIVAAVNEALRAAESDSASTMQQLTGGLNLPF